ncbi:MAG: hypothetical protein EA374_06860 [Acholeplasmatales bacterium]|nr:MAG: hypothetical protein EA374_06860 [Acholeplasmatales bacterium]
MRWILYIIFYGFLGFLLERILNCTLIGCYDNSVLTGPVQPMYGIGVTVSIFVHEQLKKQRTRRFLHAFILIVAAVLATWSSEMISGTMYERLYHIQLWDYRDTFTLWCNHPYSCLIPTTLFGLLAAFTAVTVHRFVAIGVTVLPKALGWTVIGLFFIDVVLTYWSAVWP